MANAVASKTVAQIAHEARNAQAKIDAAQRKVDRFLDHVERNNQTAIDAANKAAWARTQRLLRHQERNDALAQNAIWNRDAKKAIAAREAAGIPSIATLLADNDGDLDVVADLLLSRAA